MAVALGMLLAGAAQAAPSVADMKVRAAVEALVPAAKIESIRAAAMPGLYEVVVDGSEIYVSADGQYVMTGALWDAKAKANLTETSRAKRRGQELAAFGEERRIVFAAAKPKHTVTVFTDLDCGYCRKLHESVAAYNDAGISIEYILFPRGGLGSPSYDAAVSVWCADDRRQSLTLAKRGEPVAPKICPNPIRAGFELGRHVGVASTPTIVTENGTTLLGYVPPEQLLAQLDAL
jgi:thiol:disulfide interchange protein DsbC